MKGRRIGFDIGDVMCPDLPKRRNPDGTYRLVPPFEGCIEALVNLAQTYGPLNLFVVSRAFDDVSIQANWNLLRSWDFFRRTGIPELNIHIYADAVGDRSIKGHIATELALTDFVDDKRSILDQMPPTVHSVYLAITPKTSTADLIPPTDRHFSSYPHQDWHALTQLILRASP